MSRNDLSKFRKSEGPVDEYEHQTGGAIDQEKFGSHTISHLPYRAHRTDEAGQITYIGYADIGADPAAAVWQIKRLDESGSASVLEWADGDANFDNIWNDRITITYS